MKLHLILATLPLLAILSCSAQKDDPAPVIRPAEGAELCGEACDKMEGFPNEDGGTGCVPPIMLPDDDGGMVEVSCAEWCEYQHSQGFGWDNECVINVAWTCKEVEEVCQGQ